MQGIRKCGARLIWCVGEEPSPSKKDGDRAVPSATSVTRKAQSAWHSLGNKKPRHDGRQEVRAYTKFWRFCTSYLLSSKQSYEISIVLSILQRKKLRF